MQQPNKIIPKFSEIKNISKIHQKLKKIEYDVSIKNPFFSKIFFKNAKILNQKIENFFRRDKK
jgi:hypothetical protein